MGFDKTVESRIWGVTTQNSTVRLPIGYSAGGTQTNIKNPLRGSLLWDKCMYVLQKVAVAGGATGGSYTLTVETNAVAGEDNLPIANAVLGPNSPTTVVMSNVHDASASPLPTQLLIAQDAAGGGATFDCHVIARQYRGTLGTPGQNTAERILQGHMIRGLSNTPDFSGDEGISADVTFTLGTSGSDLGMHRMRLWDTALFWAINGATVAGTHDVDLVASVGGVTTSIATTGTAGKLNAANERLALTNHFHGQCPNPTQIIWTEVTAGGISDPRIVMIAKSGRGSMAKR